MDIRMNRKKGFTMVELMVVIGMLLLLVGAVSSSVSAAHRRARVQQATTVAQEMTKAILAFENFGSMKDDEFDSPLKAYACERKEATETDMAFILGQVKRTDGQKGNVPVLFNANIVAGAIRDPWGNPFRVTIRRSDVTIKNNVKPLQTAVSFPNFNRIPANQR